MQRKTNASSHAGCGTGAWNNLQVNPYVESMWIQIMWFVQNWFVLRNSLN